MKKQVLVIAALFASFGAFAQFNVEEHDGTPVTDGSTFATNSLLEDDSLKFYVNNESTTESINMKIEFVGATNYDGTGMQLCFGLCYDPIEVGISYPPGNEVVVIPPSSNQGIDGDKFWNQNDGGGGAIEYQFRFYQVDGAGNEIGDDLSFTYLYDPDLGVEDQSLVSARILSTIVTDQLTIEATEEVTVKVYNILGALVAQDVVSSGRSTISMNNLGAQIYLVQITNNRGATFVQKIVKR